MNLDVVQYHGGFMVDCGLKGANESSYERGNGTPVPYASRLKSAMSWNISVAEINIT